MLRAAGEEAGDDAVKVWLIEQEGIMPLVGGDFDEADIGGGAIEGAGNDSTFGGGEQPV